MNFSDKIVTTIPLENIWTDQNEIQANRTSYLTSDEIKSLLKKSFVQFIVADIGHKLKWIDKDQGFNFWRTEVERHLANDINHIVLNNFVDNYAYVASEWTGEHGTSIILLEKFH